MYNSFKASRHMYAYILLRILSWTMEKCEETEAEVKAGQWM